MKKSRIAVATKGREGLEDAVSEVFGRADTFTVIDAEEGEIRGVEILENPAMSYKYGAGPIVVKMLIDAGVSIVIVTELGPGTSTLLEQHDVATIAVKPGTSVKESVRKALNEVEKREMANKV